MPDQPQLTPAQLNNIPLFAGLDVASLQNMAQLARWREYEAGEVVVLEGDQPAGLYYLQSGWLKAVKVSAAGREQILRFLEPGDTFNEIGVFANQPNPVTVIALETAVVWLLPRTTLHQLMQERPAFAQYLLARMAERMLHLVALVSDLSLRPVTGRLARLLLADAVADVLERPRWYTQAELAARLGTVPDVIQRALRELENEGFIQVERQHIRILDRAGLAAIAA
ncbi:MAG TPA: Crp/Fnr family transcriptional regulator [Chloroflexota bacterium]|nr:Crp/Fnr family transcriptional regulator [Chloroflexota bacterium]